MRLVLLLEQDQIIPEEFGQNYKFQFDYEKELPMDEEIKKLEIQLDQAVIQQQAEGDQAEGECYSSTEEYFVDCCRYNDLEEAKDCIVQGCDFTWFNNDLNTGIHMACANGHIQILQLFKEVLDKWVDQDERKIKFVNQKNSDQNTALHWAAINNQKEVIEFMVEMLKADPNIVNSMNKTPFDEAVLFNHREAAECLAKVTKEDMSMYEGLEDSQEDDPSKEETMSDS